MLAEALDDAELTCGVRQDGFTSSFYNVLCTVSTGIALTAINAGLTLTGYTAPAQLTGAMVQPDAVQLFVIIAAFGVQLIAYPIASRISARI